MDFAWLTTFRKVIDERSYTRAAEEIFISQSAASQQVRHLELLFKARLILRDGRGLALTEAGQAVYELACAVEEGMASTRRRVDELTRAADTQVTVVSSTTPLVHRLPPVMRHFWSERPDVSIKTLLRLGKAIPEAVKSGAADVGIYSSQNREGTLQSLALRSDPLVAVCAASFPLADIEVITAQDLSDQRIAMLGTGSESRQLVEHWLAERGLAMANLLQLAGTAEIRTAAIEGIAVGVLPHYVVEDELESGRLVGLPVEDFDLHLTMHILFRPTINAAARRLIEILIEEYSDSAFQGAIRL